MRSMLNSLAIWLVLIVFWLTLKLPLLVVLLALELCAVAKKRAWGAWSEFKQEVAFTRDIDKL